MAVNKHFLSDIRRLLPATQVIEDITRRRAFGTDASFYQLIPELVLQVANKQQMQQIIVSANKHQVAITFRAAGTSLSGQAITDSVLIMLTNDWTQYDISEQGQSIRLQPGIIGADANRHLQPFARKLGPDPASINTCKIGGIAANNASGMCCGVSKNSYYSLKNMSVILANGSQLDSACAQSVAQFKQQNSLILTELNTLAQHVKADAELSALINHKYRLKNTTGYALNALVDYEDPIDILLHLMIGSEGTLGFIADITYSTVPDYPHKASALFSFVTAEQACRAVTALSKCPVEAVELMDQRALDSVKGMDGLPNRFCNNPAQTTALLIETRAESAAQLQQQINEVSQVISDFSPLQAIDFTTEQHLAAKLWAIRKATFPAVGAVRKTGSTVIIEDVSFPIAKLAEGIVRLHQLFDKFNYHEAIIFGHALAGNLHFVFTQSFESEAEIQRYDNFMQQVAELVAVEFGGSLKAEHGTGRNMAPFVELEWGKSAYHVMQRIKQILDPNTILNPGVILNPDKSAHIQHLKQMPAANPIIDKCIECGFCEPVCPSKTFSLTPRQRIAIWRRIQQLTTQPSVTEKECAELKELKKHYQHLGIDSCAATGLCAERCPVGINTGDLVRELRQEKLGSVGKVIAKWSANNFAAVTKASALAFNANGKVTQIIGKNNVDKLGRMAHKLSARKLPLWHGKWPAKAQEISIVAQQQPQQNLAKKVILFASCASRIMGPSTTSDDRRSISQVAHSVFTKAGYEVITPNKLADLCCGMPFHSKGAADIAQQKGQQLIDALNEISEQGRIPIVFDTSPCNLRIKEHGSELKTYELTEFCATFLLDKLNITPKAEAIALHITCSSQKAGIADTLRTVAQRCAEKVIEPEDIHCCGFAGDKGLFMPELNKSALAPLAKQVNGVCQQGYSNSRTCEIGLAQNSGIDYQSLIYLLDEVSQPMT